MKIVKSILITLLCAVAILTVGYAGIIVSGEQVLKSDTEPELVTMDANISNLFYSRLEDDIQLFPWNYYPEDSDAAAEDVESFFMEYSPYVENDIFYTLIALAAGVENQEVSSWYAQQEKTIMTSMKQGVEQDGTTVGLFFYDDVIRLSGKEYRVKIACSMYNIISFSCIPCREEGVKETVEWNKNKEQFMKWTEENEELLLLAWARMCDIYYNVDGTDIWYEYIYLYQDYLTAVYSVRNLDEIMYTEVDNQMNSSKEGFEADYDYDKLPIQIIEWKDSLFIMLEGDVTVGLYYDVLKQQVTGFHFFCE